MSDSTTTKKVVRRYEAVMTPSSDKQGIRIPAPCPRSIEDVEVKFDNYADQLYVTEYSLNVLKEILYKACVWKATITNVNRTARSQARIMYKNEEYKKGAVYKESGKKVLAIYHSMKAQGKSENEIIEAMVNKIKELQKTPHPVSKHIDQDPYKENVFDVAPNSIPKSRQFKFETLAEEAVTAKKVSRFLQPHKPPIDHSYHFEIEQP